MDHFGIGYAMKSMISMYLASARGTEQTTSLVDSVKDGDRVVFVDMRHARRFKDLCKERGVNVETFVCDPREPDRLFAWGTVAGEGRLIFDHVWVGEFHRLSVDRACEDIDRFQSQFSGYGAAHRETARAARERQKYAQFL